MSKRIKCGGERFAGKRRVLRSVAHLRSVIQRAKDVKKCIPACLKWKLEVVAFQIKIFAQI